MTADVPLYASVLANLGARVPSLVIVDAGLSDSMQTSLFRERFPDRSVNLGIAEANAVGFASGLARRGFRPVVHSFSNFLARRAHDQIAVSAALPGLPIVFVGGSCGVFDGGNGPSHFAGDDLATFLALPGMHVFEPADALDLDWALEQAVSLDGPSYLRLRRYGMPRLLGEGSNRAPTRAVLSTPDPSRATLLAIGSMLDETLTAARILADEGAGVDLIHLMRLKPLETAPILASVRRSGLAVIVENHVQAGGGGQAVATALAGAGLRALILSLPDVFLPAGEPRWLLAETGLDATALADRILAELRMEAA